MHTCFAWISKQGTITFLCIKLLVSVTEKRWVYCAVRTESWNIIEVKELNGREKLQSLSEDILTLFWLLYDVLCLSDSEKFVQFITNSGNWNWNISQPIHGICALPHPYWPCIIITVAKERNPCTAGILLPQMHQQNCSLCHNIEKKHCISTLTRFLGDGTLYVSGQCMEGGRGYRGHQDSKSLPLPLASRPHFKIITLRAQLNIIHVFRTSLLSSIKKGVCYEGTENFGAVQFSSGQPSGWFAFTNCQKWPHQ